jgi:pimeloyl-ACP methyl ester carboxylesterase
MKKNLLSVVIIAIICMNVRAQTNVRAWNANGQVFVVWELDTATTLLYNVFISANHVTSITNAVKVGSVFEPEWKGERITLANPNARWRIPNGNGGTYQLTANEGLFVYTPHDTLTRYIYVTRNNNTQLSPANRTTQALFIPYNPQADPVKCHLQFSAATGQGFPYSVFAMWVDGRDDPNDSRPDFPVMANAAKNGAPHVFAVFEPQNGLPTGPYPAVVCLHGGGQQGSYWSYSPNSFHYGNTGNAPNNGITIAFDDRIYLSSNGVVNYDRPTNWFGWHTQLNSTTASNAPVNGLAVPYTLRRLDWTIDWLKTNSTYNISQNRIAVMGNSMGGTGTLLLSRWKPENFSAATAFVPPHYTPETAGRLFGTSQTNLKTTEIGPDGDTLRINDFFDAGKRISTVSRDYCLTRIYRGRCDEAAEWGSEHLQLFNDLNNKGLGVHLYWDNRDHTASDWDDNDPQTPCTDIGQWVAPVRTERSEAYHQSKFKSNQSYPGIVNDDQNFAQTGRQPELGNGSPTDGDAWGTWSGYYDWDVNTIVDSSDRWECTIYLVGQSAVSVDNYNGDSAKCDVTIRKPQLFLPQSTTQLNWALIDLSNNQVLQNGTTYPDSNDVVRVNDLTFTKDPIRRRLIFENASVLGVPNQTYGNTNKVIVYPNPANDMLHINGLEGDTFNCQFYNYNGQFLSDEETSNKSISVKDLPTGFYTVIISDTKGNRYAKKLVIKK